MGAPTAPAIRARSLRSRRPRRSSLNGEPASSWSTQEAASQSERSIGHLVRTCPYPTTPHGQVVQQKVEGCPPQMWVIARLTLVANSAPLRGDRERGVEGGEAGAAGRRLGSPRPPLA